MKKREFRRYSTTEKLELLSEFFKSGESKDGFQRKRGMGHSTLSKWIAIFASHESPNPFTPMTGKSASSSDQSSREAALEARIAQLEKELDYERMRSAAYNALIDVAEENLGIDIRKKAGAKQ